MVRTKSTRSQRLKKRGVQPLLRLSPQEKTAVLEQGLQYSVKTNPVRILVFFSSFPRKYYKGNEVKKPRVRLFFSIAARLPAPYRGETKRLRGHSPVQELSSSTAQV